MSDFSVDLLLHETHNQSRDFLDKMFSASLKPHITTPTFKIEVHSMQGWTATTRHGVTRKRTTIRLKYTILGRTYSC